MASLPNDASVRKTARISLGIYSFLELENRLGLPREYLREFGADAGSRYRPFLAPERKTPFQRKFKPTKKRTIDNPQDDLKVIQRLINRRLLNSLDLPANICGGVKGRTVLDNVLCHFGAKQLVTIDIKNFFPSITNIHVYRVWHEVLGCSPKISSLLTRLTTVERHLPQGAPTSTLLANLVLFSVDGPIRSECDFKGVTYTSWVDDLAFSGGRSCEVLSLVIPALHRAGFRISRQKIKIMGPADRKTLNGVLMGKFPSVVRERFSQLRSGIHKLKTNQVPQHELSKYVQALRSRIVQVGSIVPHKAARLRRELDSVTRSIGD
jgi:hypothetical protein